VLPHIEPRAPERRGAIEKKLRQFIARCGPVRAIRPAARLADQLGPQNETKKRGVPTWLGDRKGIVMGRESGGVTPGYGTQATVLR